MQIKLRDIVAAREALQRLARLELRASVAFQVAQLLQQIEPHLANFEQQRQALVRKLGETTQGDQIVVPPERREQFEAEFNELLDLEIELTHLLDPATLIEGDVKITPGDVMVLAFLFNR